ncbi:WecB/TagA/CpsF family glycosyltransferase [uncultured Thiodictyon sp.]|uniref:WecB/TagA/CpsF family glycosyltransferase n=3 Tax=uncultured Thiodictyon sp. TaxID=1846217 RepID=UPI0025CC9CBE|nr:WecB/TagA/CpsF family glycosyltransferase [uncultured Thiodictyon sp.]
MAKSAPVIPGPLGNSRRGRWLSGVRRRAHPTLALLNNVLPRALDIAASATLLVLLSPLLLARAWWSRHQTGAILTATPLIGRFQTPFQRLSFAGTGRFRTLAVWLNIVRGEMAIVGPRPLRAEEAAAVPVEDLVRFIVRPGLISPFGIRSRIGLAHERESALDRDQVYGQTLKGDLGLAARSVVSSALGGGGAAREMPPVINFFGIPVVNTTMTEAVDWVIANAQGTTRRLMAFVNPDCLNIAWKDATYRGVLLDADRVLPDGIGIHLGCRMLGLALRANVNGTDLFPLLCEAAARAGLPIYLLGARPGVAQAAADNMVKRYPTLMIAGTRDGFFSAEEESSVVHAISQSGARILLVAFGVPRQEVWLHRWRERLAPPVCMGVGGLFDFYSGRIPRAPVWMREIGLEWLYRLIQEPGRMWRRYVIGNPLFLLRVRQQAQHPERFTLPSADGERHAPPPPDNSHPS